MNEIQNRLEHLNLCFLKIVSNFEFRASDFRSKAYNLVKTIKRFQIYQILSDTTLGDVDGLRILHDKSVAAGRGCTGCW